MKATRQGALISAGILLGSGLSGFVDGILLHQLLQQPRAGVSPADEPRPTASRCAAATDEPSWRHDDATVCSPALSVDRHRGARHDAAGRGGAPRQEAAAGGRGALAAGQRMLTRVRRTALLAVLIEALVSCRSHDLQSGLVISEFLASNTRGLRDVDGDTSDWIELHNRGAAAVDLDGWCLTDGSREPCRWRFPAVSLPAGGHLLVFASGKSSTSTAEQLHATFRLKATADYLALLRPNGSVEHEFAPYPEQRSDVSFGLTATGEKAYLRRATPGAPNSEALP